MTFDKYIDDIYKDIRIILENTERCMSDYVRIKDELNKEGNSYMHYSSLEDHVNILENISGIKK